jgi:NarL family two-component system sensor histidine kinase LiaS
MINNNERTSVDSLRMKTLTGARFFRIYGLQANMTISYVCLTVVSGLLLEILGLLLNGSNIWELTGQLLRNAIILLAITAPIGGLFGLLTTRHVIQRIRQLVTATTLFTDGDYAQRVQVTHTDEVGQLEQQFNRMAKQLVENIALQQCLAEQNARMVERARISRELHDAISQDLFSLRVLADGLQTAIQSGTQAADLGPHVAILKQTTITMTREMRALLLEMRPPQLDGLAFPDALETLASTYTSRLGIAVSTAIAAIPLRPEVEDALLRIAQEALHNAARHANATLITLSLAQEDDSIVLKIEDNGQGFREDEKSQMRGLGLHSMQERVGDLQGRFHLDTVPGRGTCICVYLGWEKIA